MKKNKLVVTAAIALAISAQAAGATFAAQSTRWEGSGDLWKVKNEDGTGYLANAWFQDLDGNWYMMGSDGYMYAGIVTDPKTGASYLLNTEHDGTYGRMLTMNGTYTLNNKQVVLTFNNANPSDATYGAITSGLDALRSAGIKETTKEEATSAGTGTCDSTGGEQTTNGKKLRTLDDIPHGTITGREDNSPALKN